MNKLSQAERDIAKILQQLELDIDCVVDTVTLKDIDITNIDSDRTVLSRRVLIETHRLPGANWGNLA